MGQVWTLFIASILLLFMNHCVYCGEIFAEGRSDKEILDQLLGQDRYDKRLLPPVTDEKYCCGPDALNYSSYNSPVHHTGPGAPPAGTLTVNVSVLLLSLASPDESSLKYEVEFLLQQQWYDPRVRYANQSKYDHLNAIHHHNDIWLPDTYFIMHGDFKDPLIPVHFALKIFRNGSVNYLMRRHLILSCQGSLHIFPFDDPLCSFAMESISYEQTAITYVWKNGEDVLRKSPSLTTLNAYLVENQTIICPIKSSWRGNYSCLKVDLKFTRDRAFYFTTVFIPGIILVTSSFITFWLEWNAVPARVMIGVTTMLNFFTTSNGFRSTLPVVSNLTAMNVWDGVCMCFIYASLLEFVAVNYVGRKRPLHNVVYRPGENPVTQRLPAVLSRIGIILASPLFNKSFILLLPKDLSTLRSLFNTQPSTAIKYGEFSSNEAIRNATRPPVPTRSSRAPPVDQTRAPIPPTMAARQRCGRRSPRIQFVWRRPSTLSPVSRFHRPSPCFSYSSSTTTIASTSRRTQYNVMCDKYFIFDHHDLHARIMLATTAPIDIESISAAVNCQCQMVALWRM